MQQDDDVNSRKLCWSVIVPNYTLIRTFLKIHYPLVRPVHVGPAPRGERIGNGNPAYPRRGAGPARTNPSAMDVEISDPVILR